MASGGSQENSAQQFDRLFFYVQQNEFAEEVFKFLCYHAEIKGYPTDYQTSSDNPGMVLTENIGKAIISIGYTCRVIFRNKFNKLKALLRDADNFERYIAANMVKMGKGYFINFLTWIAFVFDLTMYLWNEGCDFLLEAVECVACYPDVCYFHEVGGWAKLEEAALPLAHAYDKLSDVMSRELPQNVEITPFLKVAGDILKRRERRSGNNWELQTPEMRFVRRVRKELSAKYAYISTIDPRVVTTGYKVVRRNVPPNESTKKQSHKGTKRQAVPATEQNDVSVEQDVIPCLSTNVAKISISNKAAEGVTLHSEEGAEYSVNPPRSDTAESSIVNGIAEVSESAAPCAIDETRAVFVVKACFLAKRAAMKAKGAENQRAIKIISPANRTEELSNSLTEILDKCIKYKRYKEIAEDLLAVGPPGFDVEDDDNRMIVLDTSSEEEGNIDKRFDSDEMQTRIEEFSPSIVSEDSITFTETETKVEENLMKHPVAKLPEQNEFVPASSTGAITKVRPYVRQTDEVNSTVVDEDISGKTNRGMDPNGNDNVEDKTSKCKKNKKKQKRKKPKRY